MALVYSTLLVLILIPIFLLENGQLLDPSLYSSHYFQGYLTGTLAAWFAFSWLIYRYGEKKRHLSFDKKWSGALLHLLPFFLIAVACALIFDEVLLYGYRILIGLIGGFIYGGLTLKLSEYTKSEDKSGEIPENKYQIAFRFVQKTEEGYANYVLGSGKPLFIECSASQPVTVALLLANRSGRPHCPYPLFKANADIDVLYKSAIPFELPAPDQGFRLWIVGSPDHGQLMDFIARDDLAWPELAANFKIL